MRQDRALAVVTLTAIIVICLLAFVPFEILVTVVGPVLLVCTVASVWMLSRALSRPLNEDDAYCDRVDQELKEDARLARQARRLERAREREASPIRHVGGGWRL